MTFNPALSTLAGVLAEIYSDDASIRRVARESKLSLSQIAFDARPNNTWSSVLTEASHQGKVENIIAIALKEYPVEPDLRAAAAAFQVGDSPTPPPSAPISQPPPSALILQPPPAMTPRRPTEAEKRALAQALLECDAMNSRAARDAVVASLPAQIRQRIKYGSNDLIDVLNIVSTAANFPGGLRDLTDCVRLIEGDTFTMQEVDRLAAPFV